MKREIFIGSVGIGGAHPVSIQSMTNTAAADVEGTLGQIRRLRRAGCDIVRLAVPDRAALPAFGRIVARSPLPVIADIHFDAALALGAMEGGASGIRINPGNIGGRERLKAVIRLAAQKRIPIRIGVNAGSLEKKHRRSGRSVAEAMVRSLLDQVAFFEDQGFFALKLSLKSHDVRETVVANRLADRSCQYPLHLGVTEAGTFLPGSIRSAVGIGSLLLDGIGNTIRVSLTADPVREVRVARQILMAAGLAQSGIDVVSCPTCARASVDLIPMVAAVEKKIGRLRFPGRLRVAVMGCEVNGPGEARDADIGLAFSRRHGFLFKKGRIVGRTTAAEAVSRLCALIEEAAGEKRRG
ncbi:MAG: flavodoxin-dependent (E)-4-hydroxy-3-methylbut-2-enyl-diphosphate synthase [Candidatus Aminicenantes bacterium]|nr:flavodoxin-dependent (E)-4-hydroxy-3-methylbut-2-enyl-diphosphate synthase [Candidatus Aminicenantes bacterium]